MYRNYRISKALNGSRHHLKHAFSEYFESKTSSFCVLKTAKLTCYYTYSSEIPYHLCKNCCKRRPFSIVVEKHHFTLFTCQNITLLFTFDSLAIRSKGLPVRLSSYITHRSDTWSKVSFLDRGRLTNMGFETRTSADESIEVVNLRKTLHLV